MTTWQPIETYDGCGPALVSAPNGYGHMREPISAFRDVTGVWRILGTPGGMTKLRFAPTVWTLLPAVTNA